MGSCPFCKSEVADELLLFGGSCPTCFLPIAGEEEPTDPGVERQKEMVAEVHAEQVKSARKQQVIVGAMVCLLVGLVGIGWLQSQPQETADDLMAELPLPVAADAVAPADLVEQEVIQETPAEQAQGKTVQKKSSEKSSTTKSTAAKKSSSRSVAVGELGEEVDAPDLGLLSVRSNTDVMGGLDLTVNRKEEKGITLTTDDQIMTMVGRTLDTQTPKLRSCYERRLKVKEDLQGVWVIGLTVNKDGSVSNVDVTAQETADSELERCIEKRVEGWSFQPISKTLPVNKLVSFTPR